MNQGENRIKFAICQLNFTVGAIRSNTSKICKLIDIHKKSDIDIFIFPELALTGYIPFDQMNYKSLHNEINESLELIQNQLKSDEKEIFAIIGAPSINQSNQTIYNSAYIISGKKIYNIINKSLLPNYDIFHERRYFVPAEKQEISQIKGMNLGIHICEDMWNDRAEHKINVCTSLADLKADILINISASPFDLSKPQDRVEVAKKHVINTKLPFIYVNTIGGQDEITFDGRSFIIDSSAKLVYQAKPFVEEIKIIEFDKTHKIFSCEEFSVPIRPFEQEIIDAIKLNLSDYIKKNHLNKKVIIGLSGGIDSALTTYLAVEALGVESVQCIYLPTKFSSDLSKSLAYELAHNLGLELVEISIENSFRNLLDTISKSIEITEWGIAEENLQARIRGMVLMYVSNKEGGIVISTGNKSEIAVGYTTLYGDSVGGKNLIGDMYKTQVYAVARFINREKEIIPSKIISRAPTAELRENQKDSDSLPDYEILDKILMEIIDEEHTLDELIEKGFDKDLVQKIIHLIKINEFKRSQMVQTVKLQKRAFGIGRIIPITSHFNYQ